MIIDLEDMEISDLGVWSTIFKEEMSGSCGGNYSPGQSFT
jgi:hypothetical protein